MATHPTATRHLTELDQALAGAAPAEQVELVMAELTSRFTLDSVAWAVTLGTIADRNDLEPHVVRRCAAELARLAREQGQRLPDDREKRLCRNAPNPAESRRTLAYAHGHRLRLDLKFAELGELTPRWLAAHPQDALLRSLDAFAALGSRDDRAIDTLERASTLPDFDGSCRAVCLHGLWFGWHLRDQPTRIVTLSDQMINNGEDDPDLYYWRAFALRRLGRFDDAVTSIDRALTLLPVVRTGTHEAYARERALIADTRRLSEQVTHASGQLQEQVRQHRDQLLDQFGQHQRELREQSDQARQQQHEQARQHREDLHAEAERHTDAARRIVSDSLIGIVNVLALFAILVTVLVVLAMLALTADQLGQSLALLGTMLVGAAVVFWAMRLVAGRDRSRRERTQPWQPVGRLAEYLGFRDQRGTRDQHGAAAAPEPDDPDGAAAPGGPSPGGPARSTTPPG